MQNEINRIFFFSTTPSSVQVKIKKKGEKVEHNRPVGKQNSDIIKIKKRLRKNRSKKIKKE